MKKLLGLLLSLFFGSALAEVYKWVDADGLVHYSDEPQGNAKPFTPPEISVFKFRVPVSKPTQPTNSDTVSEPDPLELNYRVFEVTRPSNNETLNAQAPQLDVEFKLEPALQKGHYIELSLDGNPVGGRVQSSSTLLSGVSAGSHILSARILALDGRQLARTKSVLFHYQPEGTAGAETSLQAVTTPHPEDRLP